MAVQRSIGTRNADSSTAQTPNRAGAYLEAYVQSVYGGNQTGADEGSYYVCTNATTGTGLAGHAAPVVADTDTKALLHCFNGTAFNLIPDYVFLEYTAIGAGGTIQYTTVYIDNKGSTARTGGGTQLTPALTKSNGTDNSSGLLVFFGPVVTAMSSSKKVGQQVGREVIPVVEDTYIIKFGGPNAGYSSGLTTASTATGHMIKHMPPVCVGPGGNLNVAEIRPSQSGANSFQVEFGFWLR